MEADGGAAPSQGQLAPPAVEAVAPPKVERLNPVVQQQLNLESVKTRALGLYKTISHILEDFEAFARSNTTPKWHATALIIVPYASALAFFKYLLEAIFTGSLLGSQRKKKKSFDVISELLHCRQDALGQFSMVSMDLFNIVEDIKNVSKAFVVYPRNVNAENATILPVMLSSKLLPEMEAEDTTKREQLLLGISGLPVHMQIEKLKTRIDMIGAACEAAEKVISDCRKAYGLGSRQGPTLVPTLDKVQAAKIQEQENLLRAAVNFGEGFRIPIDQRQLPTSLPSHLADVLSFGDGAQNLGDNAGAYGKNTSSFSSNQGVLQTAGGQLIGRSVPSPSNAVSFDNASTPPMAYANSPRSGTNIMNTPSPQQQVQQQQQQRQKILQLPHQQQLLVQQQLRQSSAAGVLGQGVMSQLHDLTGQTQQKLQQITNMSASMQSQSLLPRIQFGLTGGHTQRNHPSQMLNDQMFGMGPSNPANMIAMQQQQQGGFGNISTHTQNLQSGMVNLPNTTQNPNFPQQRQQNQS
ncbi:hypothetical protein ZIOFF_019946 [Zingiber officinale]|uniref:Mediator of RNA polymerase II transcription subunit 8 n=1 Tax=Zingiber officinale TaxID=94328 RepID=A0A8J5HEX0_ZINOF|nr:hypothetical protein ZIOFF_019946 [Zingiber officinale]